MNVMDIDEREADAKAKIEALMARRASYDDEIQDLCIQVDQERDAIAGLEDEIAQCEKAQRLIDDEVLGIRSTLDEIQALRDRQMPLFGGRPAGASLYGQGDVPAHRFRSCRPRRRTPLPDGARSRRPAR